MYDLLLKGGDVVDPSSGLNGPSDVAVQAGAIARIAPNIPSVEAARTIDVTGKVVAPGLIDVHAHVFEGVNRTGVNPDLAGVYAGVTTIVDAGSSGSATRSEEHTSELQSQSNLVCRLLLEKKKHRIRSRLLIRTL